MINIFFGSDPIAVSPWSRRT